MRHAHRSTPVRNAACVVATALLVRAPVADAFCRNTTRRPSIPGECATTGIPLAWRGPCVGFSLHAAGSPSVPFELIRAETARASARWRALSCASGGAPPFLRVEPFTDTRTPTGFDRTGRNANTVSFNTVWREDAAHRLGAISITLVTFEVATGEILDADMELNEQSERNPDGFRFTSGAVDPELADLPSVLTHEFGHFQGLAHSADEAAIMWPTTGFGEHRRDPTADDRDGICGAYPPERAPDAGCDASPTGGFSPGGCGCRTAPWSQKAPRGLGFSLLAAASARAVRRRRAERRLLDRPPPWPRRPAR